MAYNEYIFTHLSMFYMAFYWTIKYTVDTVWSTASTGLYLSNVSYCKPVCLTT